MKRKPLKEKDLLHDIGIRVKAVPKEHVATLDLDIPLKEVSSGGLRFLAKMAYVTSMKSISIEKLQDTEPFVGRVAQGVMYRWSKEDNWPKCREDYRRKIEKKILDKLSDAHIKAISDQLEMADSLSAKMYGVLHNDWVVPKTFEGMVQALMNLEKFRFEARKEVASLLASQISETGEEIDVVETPKPEYNKEALLELAHALINKEIELRNKDENSSVD